ncbi:putative DNA-binding transcriptional regulator AlpA [Novosphingobium sp. 1748]|uniref:helix-turn-helix transcriptional regulator n=1 Tax=Novosphingobium sp. 1748 TaxID=2817760 RepID=UPI00285487F6|nr:hypothetical protein [Novosphingobium sp. 1748]MDR6710142.1 putative DNA-binding transcriptional regulator AlpA [Novosphingobium sp. 1748]
MKIRAGAAIGDFLPGVVSGTEFITADEFALLARLSRRQIDRLRKRRLPGFPREYDLGSGLSKFHTCPRFRRVDVERWLDSRSLW